MASSVVTPPTNLHTPIHMSSRQMFTAGWPLPSSATSPRWTRCCHSDAGQWVKFQTFSLLWSRVLSGLHLPQLILHLACVARALCQTHRLWKNNLTGFNLPPHHHHHHHPLHPLLFLLLVSPVAFLRLGRRTEPILSGSSVATPGSFLQVRLRRFEASGVEICLVCRWRLSFFFWMFYFFFLMFSGGVQFGLCSY